MCWNGALQRWLSLSSDFNSRQSLTRMRSRLACLLYVCAEGGHVYPNDGAAYFKARFRLVVFRPFVGEVLVGTLTACTK